MALNLRKNQSTPLTWQQLDGNFEYFTGSHAVTGSLTVTGGVTGSLLGTASYALYAISASYEINYETSSSYADTASVALVANTASYVDAANVDGTVTNASTASYVDAANVDGTVTNALTASYVDGANVDGYVDYSSNSDQIYTTTTGLPAGDYPLILGFPGVVDDFTSAYSQTNLIFNPSTNNLTISGSVLVSGSIIPNTDGVSTTSSFDLGSPTNAWKDIYVSNGTINFLDAGGNVVQTLGTDTNQFSGSTDIIGDTTITGSLTVTQQFQAQNFRQQDAGGNLKIGNTSWFNIGGTDNLGIGGEINQYNTEGSNNTIIGNFSLQINESGSNNTIIGKGNLIQALSSSENVVLGTNIGAQFTSGSNNIFLGHNASYVYEAGDSNIVIGNNATPALDTTGSIIIGHGANNNIGGNGDFVLGSETYPIGPLEAGSFTANYALNCIINGTASKILLEI